MYRKYSREAKFAKFVQGNKSVDVPRSIKIGKLVIKSVNFTKVYKKGNFESCFKVGSLKVRLTSSYHIPFYVQHVTTQDKNIYIQIRSSTWNIKL